MSHAEDLTGDVFLKAFDAIGSFRPTREKAFSSWLYTIATNTFLDSVKRKKESSLDDIEFMIPDGNGEDMTQKVQVNQQTEEIMTYLEQLGAEKKDLFVMRIRQELSREEIEEITGKSNASLRKEYSRLIQKLIDKFGYMAVLCILA